MIISASRRTDIPAFYSEWFFNRIKEGFVDVRNTVNPFQISRISLSPEVVDGIVFWTKNPGPMLERLDELKDYTYYFQFTLTSYAHEVEPGIPSKSLFMIPMFKRLSEMIGKERVIWRYDPIFISEKYSVEYHKKYFAAIAERLSGYTEKCIVSFVDLYGNVKENIAKVGGREPSSSERNELMEHFAKVAAEYGISLETCAEEEELEKYGIQHAHCIDKELLERIGGFTLDVGKDKYQRKACGCIESIDIGAYKTCKHGCAYCYANSSCEEARKNFCEHDPSSTMLIGHAGEKDEVKVKEVKSFKQDFEKYEQITL